MAPDARRFASIAALLALAACGPRGHSEGYLQACHGEPLTTPEAREAAMVEGYDIYPGYECITKESWAAVQEQKARYAAETTPEAIAKRAQERIARNREADASRAAAAAAETAALYAPPEPVDISPVNANTATQARLAQVISIGPEVAAQIVAARKERPFRDWNDLVMRVVGLSAAQTAVYASICGLVVDGESLSGAPPDARLAAQIREKYRAYE